MQADHKGSSSREWAVGHDQLYERFPANNKVNTTKGGPQFSLSMNMTQAIETVKGNPYKRCIQFKYTCSCHCHCQFHCNGLAIATCSAPSLAPVIRFAVQAFLSHNMEPYHWFFTAIIAKDPNHSLFRATRGPPMKARICAKIQELVQTPN